MGDQHVARPLPTQKLVPMLNYDMKTHGGADVQIHVFLTSTLVGKRMDTEIHVLSENRTHNRSV
jgi:hypothetical protein